MEKIRTHKELRVYKFSFKVEMEVVELNNKLSSKEIFLLTNQVRRPSRAVSGIIAEEWRKRRYPKSYVPKHNDAEVEGAETQVWPDYSLVCNHINLSEYELFFEKMNISLPC